jgi:hypothetical protein
MILPKMFFKKFIGAKMRGNEIQEAGGRNWNNFQK